MILSPLLCVMHFVSYFCIAYISIYEWHPCDPYHSTLVCTLFFWWLLLLSCECAWTFVVQENRPMIFVLRWVLWIIWKCAVGVVYMSFIYENVQLLWCICHSCTCIICAENFLSMMIWLLLLQRRYTWPFAVHARMKEMVYIKNN